MSALGYEVTKLNDEDRVCIMNAMKHQVLRGTIALAATIIILYYALFEYNYSVPLLLVASIILFLTIANLFFAISEYKMFNRAVIRGEKDVFSGTVLTKYSKHVPQYRNPQNHQYFVVIKESAETRKDRADRLKKLKDNFLNKENQDALKEYENLIAQGNDNDPIQISEEEYERIKEGDQIEFHCLKSVMLGSSWFNKNMGLNNELSFRNFFILKIVSFQRNL